MNSEFRPPTNHPHASRSNGFQVKNVKLLVASDCPLMRAGLIATIRDEPGHQICGEATSCDDVLASLDASGAEVLILDISTRNGMGIQLVTECRQHHDQLRILVLSSYEEWLYAAQILKAGAMACIGRSSPLDIVVQALRSLIAGKVFIKPELVARMVGHTDRNCLQCNPISQLTQREFQIFELIGQGKTSKAIARSLKISVHTVETYRERLKMKLDAGNGAELVFQAIVWRLLHE
jgi:DNA-binding NarL/FixJ family response regulator